MSNSWFGSMLGASRELEAKPGGRGADSSGAASLPPTAPTTAQTSAAATGSQQLSGGRGRRPPRLDMPPMSAPSQQHVSIVEGPAIEGGFYPSTSALSEACSVFSSTLQRPPLPPSACSCVSAEQPTSGLALRGVGGLAGRFGASVSTPRAGERRGGDSNSRSSTQLPMQALGSGAVPVRRQAESRLADDATRALPLHTLRLATPPPLSSTPQCRHEETPAG